jgi:hypothetical protein
MLHFSVFLIKICFVGFEVHIVVVMNFYFLGYNAMQCIEGQSTFQRNRSPLSGAQHASCFHADLLLGLFFTPEDGSDMFL